MYLEVTKKCSEEGSVGHLQKEMCDAAISALKEIQQYRAIGTVEEFEKLKLAENGTIWSFIDEYVAYKQVGTVEECRADREKQSPKKPRILVSRGGKGGKYCVCPSCGGVIGKYIPFCRSCGQAIQWDENLEGMEDE